MEEFVTLFELFVGIEACNLSYNVVTTILNFRRNSALEEAQKSVNILSKRCNEIHSYYENLMTEKSAYIRGLLCKIEELQKQGEQKPANKCEGCNNAKGCVACVDGSEWAHIEEQNPAWSEEDKGVLLESISVLQNSSHWVLADKLKSLKDRVGCEVNCTTTKAWSEEDEKIGKELIDFCIKCSQGTTVVNSQNDFTRWTVWLKSLKDRVGNFDDGYKVGFSAAKHNQWKPSDEQMERLKGTINSLPHQEVLYSLYQDLLKLKG